MVQEDVPELTQLMSKLNLSDRPTAVETEQLLRELEADGEEEERRMAVTKLQACARGFLLRKRIAIAEAEQEQLRRVHAVTHLQARVRGWLLRKLVAEQTRAAVVLQQAWRVRLAAKMEQQRRVEEKMRRLQAAVVLQRWWRARMAKTEFQRLRLQQAQADGRVATRRGHPHPHQRQPRTEPSQSVGHRLRRSISNFLNGGDLGALQTQVEAVEATMRTTQEDHRRQE